MEGIFKLLHTTYPGTNDIELDYCRCNGCEVCLPSSPTSDFTIWKSNVIGEIDLCDECYQTYRSQLDFCRNELSQILPHDVIMFVVEYLVPKWAKVACASGIWEMFHEDKHCSPLVAGWPCGAFTRKDRCWEHLCSRHGKLLTSSDNKWASRFYQPPLSIIDYGLYPISMRGEKSNSSSPSPSPPDHEYIIIDDADRTKTWRCLRTRESDMVLPGSWLSTLASKVEMINQIIKHTEQWVNKYGWWGSVVSINDSTTSFDAFGESVDVTFVLGSIRSWIMFSSGDKEDKENKENKEDKGGERSYPEDTFAIVCCDIRHPLYAQVYTAIADNYGRMGVNDSGMKIDEYLAARDAYYTKEMDEIYYQVHCNGCASANEKEWTIVGPRYRCGECRNLNLCAKCHASKWTSDFHKASHNEKMVLIKAERISFIRHLYHSLSQARDYG